MTNENYNRCRTCRFCINSKFNWVCIIRCMPTYDMGSCERYRPGFCENCHHLKIKGGKILCEITGEETDILSVCSDYDPSGRRSI